MSRTARSSNAPTIVDVARLAGVSTATVSRVLNGHKVGAVVRARVDAVMNEMHFHPNVAAQAMRAKSSRTIACAIRGVLMPEMNPFIRAADAVCREAGFSFMLTALYESVEGQRDTLATLFARGIDGLLVTPAAHTESALKQAIANNDVPTVVLDRDAPSPAHVVDIDHASGMCQAVDHLVGQGHTRIALLTVSRTLRPGRERIQGFVQRMAHHQLPHGEDLISDQGSTAEAASAACFQLLRQQPECTAIIAGGMGLLPTVLRCAQLMGKQVGRDLAVLAGCDSELAELKSPGISALRWDLAEWGTMAARMVIEAIAEPARTPQHVTLRTELIVRASTLYMANARQPDK